MLKKIPSLRLQNRNEVDCLDVRIVFGKLFFRDLPFSVLLRKLVNSGLRLGIGLEGNDSPGDFGRQAFGERIKNSIQRFVRRYLCHVGIVTRCTDSTTTVTCFYNQGWPTNRQLVFKLPLGNASPRNFVSLQFFELAS